MNVPRGTKTGMCKPCHERGNVSRATKTVDDTRMCLSCFSEGNAGVTCSVISLKQVPDSYCGPIHQGIQTLKADEKVALKLSINSIAPDKVQRWAHTYAERLGIRIKTKKVDGIIYVTRRA